MYICVIINCYLCYSIFVFVCILVVMSYDHIAPFTEGKSKKSKMWHKSIENSNKVFNRYYHPREQRVAMHYYADHIVYYFRKSALIQMHQIWPRELEKTSAQRFRSGEDMVISYIHHNMLLEENAGIPAFDKGKTIRWSNSRWRNSLRWSKILESDGIIGFCIQDEFKYSKDYSEIERETDHLTDVLCSKFFHSSPYEADSNPCLSVLRRNGLATNFNFFI